MFCYQQNFVTPTRQVDRELFWSLVKAPFTKECVNKFRQTGDAAWKKRLPAFIFQATFDESLSRSGFRGTWRKQSATRLNGLCVLDVDHVDDVETTWTFQLQNKDLKGLGILLVYVTPSGKGLKVVFKADADRGNLIDNINAMAQRLGLEADQSCKDASRMSFICTEQDILFIDEAELFTYENRAFAEKYEAQYRGGKSQSALAKAQGGGEAAAAEPQPVAAEALDEQLYHGVPFSRIIDCWLGHQQPSPGDRHRTSLMLADHLRYITDNNAALIEALLRRQPFVKAIVDERGENVAQTVKSAMNYTYWKTLPQRLRLALKEAGVHTEQTQQPGQANTDNPLAELPLAEWGEKIAAFFDLYPCLREACGAMEPESFAAVMFTAAAFLGTLMTRTWYHFYHRPEEERRLNYCVLIIGDPASGKSFATRLYDLLADPILVADQVGYDALNKYKREVKERTTSSKAQKDEPLKKPVVIIRDHPSRTSNAQFIADMNAAVEEVSYVTHDEKAPMATKPMHLHMLTFDSELDNSTTNQRGGSWISKESMELKAFHNERDGQAYSNLDSVMGQFNVYWNFVYTGTPLSLSKKVTVQNFGSGLATRLAVIPLPPSGFKMMSLRKTTSKDQQADALLKEWAYKLDEVRGELPLWPLVEEAWNWTSEQMALAEAADSKVQEMLLKRVPYYGICVSAPFILMRHWEEWKKKASFSIDESDLMLCRLVLDIQYQCQTFFFTDYAEKYFENKHPGSINTAEQRFKAAFSSLAQTFTTADVARCFGVKHDSARMIVSRMTRRGLCKTISKGQYEKTDKQ